jgi:hypothetical protein
MPENKQSSENKNKRTFKSSSNASIRRSQAQQLQTEIDKLALLLYETKKQTDKLQAVADAMGEAVLRNLDA